jgi:chromosome segregation ATPase
VLYLAEVQKQKGGLLSNGKAELKLLACQRNDQSWSSIAEELITAEEASKLNDGAMVMVELSPQRQVQRIQEAGKPLVNILQNYSRQVEKFKAKEEEIDQWKESLTFQAQELSRRELEMEDRIAQLQQLEEECQNLDSQQQAVDSSRAEFERLTEEIERNRQELEGAWEHLRGEQRRLEENQAEYQQGTFVDAARAALLRELLDRLANGVPATDTVLEHLGFAVEMTDMQQELINPHWQKFQLRKAEVEQQQVEIEGLLEEFAEIQNELQISETALDHQTSELKDNIAKLNSKQEYVVILRGYLRYQEDMYQQMYSLAAMSGSVSLDESFDIEAFESMPLEELEQTVKDLQEKLSVDSSFVNDQELELKYKQETIEDLKQKISQTADSDRALYEEELKDEKDLYQMLNETLVGQRRNLLQRQDQLRAHQTVLLRRQGKGLTSEQQENQADLIPILAQIESQRRQQSDELQSMEREVEQIQASIDLTEGMIESQIQEMEEKRQELRVKEENLQLFQTAQAESKAVLEFYEETLQPIQDSVDGLRQKLQGVGDSLTLVQESGNSQQEAVNEMREILMSFIAQPELATS